MSDTHPLRELSAHSAGSLQAASSLVQRKENRLPAVLLTESILLLLE